MIPEGRIENVRGSVMKYLADNFTTVPIAYPRTDFKSEDTPQWIAPDIMVGAKIFKRQTGDDGRLGYLDHLMLNINIFAKREFVEGTGGGTGETGNTYCQERIRDELADLFKVGTEIQIKDYVGNPSSPNNLGMIQCLEVTDQDMALDKEAGLYQYNVTAEMICIEEHL